MQKTVGQLRTYVQGIHKQSLYGRRYKALILSGETRRLKQKPNEIPDANTEEPQFSVSINSTGYTPI